MDEERASDEEEPTYCSSDESVCGPEDGCLREPVLVEGDSSEDEELILLPRTGGVGSVCNYMSSCSIAR